MLLANKVKYNIIYFMFYSGEFVDYKLCLGCEEGLIRADQVEEANARLVVEQAETVRNLLEIVDGVIALSPDLEPLLEEVALNGAEAIASCGLLSAVCNRENGPGRFLGCGAKIVNSLDVPPADSM